MSALTPMLLAGAFPGSAFAQVNYVPYSGQPAYAAPPAAQQQYYVYVPQQSYAQPQQSYVPQQSYMPQQQSYAAAVPPYTGTVAPGYAAQTYASAAPQTYAAPAPRTYAVATTQTYAASAPQTYAAPAQQSYAAPAPPPAPAAEGHGGFLAGIFGGPTIQAQAPAYTGTVATRYGAQTYAPAAPQTYATPAQQTYAVATTQTYAAPAQQSYAAPAPPPAPAAEGHGGFLAGIFGGPTIQAHVYQPFAPQYQTPAAQPTAINPAPASYTPSSQGDMSNYPIDPRYLRQEVMYPTDEKPGTIVIDPPNKFLYLVEDNGRALRYGIGVGRPGFTWSGTHTITAKREWPDWYPPVEMLQRRPDLPRYMPGGMDNPLGARAMYLGSTLYRIHGSNEPWTIGTNVSSGCIRMRNADVEDLYNRVKVGTKVLVI